MREIRSPQSIVSQPLRSQYKNCIFTQVPIVSEPQILGSASRAKYLKRVFGIWNLNLKNGERRTANGEHPTVSAIESYLALHTNVCFTTC